MLGWAGHTMPGVHSVWVCSSGGHGAAGAAWEEGGPFIRSFTLSPDVSGVPPEGRHCLKGTVEAPSLPFNSPRSGEGTKEGVVTGEAQGREMGTQSRPRSGPWGQGGL